MKDGVTKEPMTKATFLGIYQSSLKNAGYLCGTSIHAIRHYLGKMVDKRYTETERSQHITQSDPRIFGQSYVANCSSVDGQAAFLGEAAQHDHINYFQGLRKFCEKGLPNRLPAKIEASLRQDSNLLELKNKVQQLEADENVDPCEISMAKSKVREYFRSLKAKTLQQYKQDWVRNRRDWKVTTHGKEPAKDVNRTDFTQSLFLVMPECGRLAKMMASDEPLIEGEIQQAMQDLYSLCVRDYTVLYRLGEEPIDGACLVKCCRLKMERGQHTKEHNPKQDKGLVNQKRKRQGGVTHNGKRQKVTEGAPQTDIITSSSEASTTLDSWTVKSPSPSSIFTETVNDFKNSTISPNLMLLSPIRLSMGGDHNGDNFPSLPEFQTVNV
ncbi:MAG: hypothetical protein M1840_008026 [Geoglossum simile]|nr:MAG: hypothetical protein M1840_008026 [Geoglossum simile]